MVTAVRSPGRTGALHPAVAAVRTAVRRAFAELPEQVRTAPPVVACSGGADSLALAAATRAVRGPGVRAVVVDHGLQEGSGEVARATADLLGTLDIAAEVRRVEVTGPGGPEAAARRARYAALRAARPDARSPVLLGHTLDDQAETVLLGLGRGSGPRSLAGMRPWDAPWLRPLLGIRRTTTRQACEALGLPVWDDPHNSDPRYTRVRLRREVLPLLEEVLAGGVAEALARTAAQLREDCDALDSLAADLLTAAREESGLAVEPLSTAPAAVRRRVLRRWLLDEAGVPELTDRHLRAADDLVGRWRGQGAVTLPGGLDLQRGDGRLVVRRRHPSERTSRPS